MSDNQTVADNIKYILLEFENKTVAVRYFNWLKIIRKIKDLQILKN